MSSLVNEDHWKERLDGMPMPEGATAEMLWAAEDAINEIKFQEYTLDTISFYQKLHEYYTKKKEDWLTKTWEPDYHKKLAMLDIAAKETDNMITYLRETLNG